MNMTVTNHQAISDYCRFLLMEMGIGVLQKQMQQIIDSIMENFPLLANPPSNQLDEAYHNIILKVMNEAYDQHVMHYAKLTGMISLKSNAAVNPSEQLLFLQQLANRQFIRKHHSPLPSQFSIREALQYMPGFQGKILCYGVKPSHCNTCIPIHPWLWRKQLKHHYYANALPCIHPNNSYFASSDPFYLQDSNGNYLSYHHELSCAESEDINQKLQSLALSFKCRLLETSDVNSIPRNDHTNLTITSLSSPLRMTEDDSVLLPYQLISHPDIQHQLMQTIPQIQTMVKEPLNLLSKHFKLDLRFYQFNPLIIVRNAQFTGVIYRHLLPTTDD
ncbi:hypothetical protein [Legionella sp. W05-934-2]|jgi:hypothetical protein|uniref:hypothetical protein n=1 Tax=Legionella sp. W05-934-2 TaxID=1198649 RepID=UPI0034637C7D